MATVRSMTDDDALARQAASGDRVAFAGLVRRHTGLVYGLCRRLLGDDAEAEDRTQETFLKALRSLDRYDPDRPFRPWLLRIARNTCLDALRARRTWVPLDEGAAAVEPAQPLDWSVRDTLAAAVDGLAPQQRAVVQLKYGLGLTGPEIADRLDSTPGAVRVCLHRALQTLRRRLTP